MPTPSARDRGLTVVRRATLWLAGGAVVAAGAFAVLLDRSDGAGAGASDTGGGTSGVGGATVPSPSPSTTLRGGARTSPSTTIAPPARAPSRSTRRRPSTSSGGS